MNSDSFSAPRRLDAGIPCWQEACPFPKLVAQPLQAATCAVKAEKLRPTPDNEVKTQNLLECFIEVELIRIHDAVCCSKCFKLILKDSKL